MAKYKRKRKKRVLRYKNISTSTNHITADETPAIMRKKFPQDLIDTFVKVCISGWADKPYNKYIKQVKAFLGKKYKDRIESGKLTVGLSRACYDLTNEIKKQNLPKKLICGEHPKYKAMRTPRSNCKRCWDIYNGKKTIKKTKKKAKNKI